jgi:hypothetical protein
MWRQYELFTEDFFQIPQELSILIPPVTPVIGVANTV